MHDHLRSTTISQCSSKVFDSQRDLNARPFGYKAATLATAPASHIYCLLVIVVYNNYLKKNVERISMWQPFHDSKYNRTCSGIDIRSPLINVRILLSSITEFMLSIHNVSTGPSNIIHFSSGFSSK